MYDDRESSVQGGSYTYRKSIPVTASDPLTKAWMTFKASRSDPDPGILQKTITTADIPGTGRIENNGAATGIAVVRFDLWSSDTTGMSPRDYWFDVKVMTVGTSLSYPFSGIWNFWQNVTTAST